MEVTEANKDKPPPAVFSAPPEADIERAIKKNPHDPNLKADLGSDESMDASDPPSAAQANTGEPAPSSTFPE